MVTKYLTDGGIPDGWSFENLNWLAQAHRRHAEAQRNTVRAPRAQWHQRWAALIEDVLETARVDRY